METLEQILLTQIAQIEEELLAFLSVEPEQTSVAEDASADQAWTRNIVRLQTIPGIGLITAMWLVVATMNFTLCASAEQAAAYAGLAPMMQESGTSV
jgi:transposase